MNQLFKILLCLLLINWVTLQSYAQEYVVNYQHIQTKDGLANAFVNCAMQDGEGFMWFGTNDGLCRYDGKNFLTFRNDEEEGIFLGSNAIQDIVQLDERFLLIGTTAGLSKLDLYTQKISTIDFFNQRAIFSIFIDSEKTIWIISNEQLFFNKNGVWESYATSHQEFEKKQITGIYERFINNKQYFIITEKIIQNRSILLQISYKEKNDKQWKKICLTPYLPSYFENSKMWFLYKKQKNNDLHQVYDTTVFKLEPLDQNPNEIGRLGKPFSSSIQIGNYLYGHNSEQIVLIDNKKNKVTKTIEWDQTSLNASKYGIIFIYKDKTNNLWICTNGAGIVVVPIYTLFSIKEYKYKEDNPSKSLSGASVRAIYQDKNSKDIWVGMYNNVGDIDIFSPKNTKKTVSYNSVPYVLKKQLDNPNILWLGSYQGLFKIKTSSIKEQNQLLSDGQINDLLPINDSTIWLIEEKTLKKYNPITKQEIDYPEYGNVVCLYLDKKNTIWVGSFSNGVAVLDTTKEKVNFYNPQKNAKNKSCHVMAIYQDSKDKMWLATSQGLYNFDTKTQKFRHYTKKDGLPNTIVYAALEDENYNLWLSTNSGICKFDPKKETFENYDESDGLQNNEFNQKAYFKNEEGELFFGGINGMNTFFPKDMKRNNYIPPLFFTKITKQDVVIHFDKPLQQVKEIRLPIGEAQILGFEFVALNYYRPEKNQYAYKIDELQNDWISLGNEGKLTLTGLAYGNYTLRIKASNNHDVWNEDGLTLRLILIPPFYLQTWFLVSVFILFLILVYSIYRWRMYQVKKNERRLKEQIQKATQALADKNILFEEQNQALEKANNNQNQLFAIIAHDLRSPLIAFQDISTQIKYFLKKNNPEGLLNLGGYIDSSVQNLNNLLNNLLNWALTQQHQIKHQPQSISLKNTIEEIKNLYQTLAQSIQVKIETNIDEKLTIYVDRDSFQTIIRNLISNALKFTPKDGTITIVAHQEENQHQVILKLTDTGIGISKETQKDIFQLNLAHTRKGLRGEKSTGLGLVLCYEFAQMNGVSIDVESQTNEGTTFILVIPSISQTEKTV